MVAHNDFELIADDCFLTSSVRRQCLTFTMDQWTRVTSLPPCGAIAGYTAPVSEEDVKKRNFCLFVQRFRKAGVLGNPGCMEAAPRVTSRIDKNLQDRN